MKILSCFDGISCGQLALQRAGIKVDKYYASEVDKHCISITQKNFPNTIQLGDINNYESWDLPEIDMIIGGSPCQDLSIAKKNRQGLKGERSKLFYKYVECLKKFKPKYFLLENNYSMPKESKEEITRIMGVEPILINSALVSAQQRRRWYWTNIPGIEQPEDKGILLKDILESGVNEIAYSLAEQVVGRKAQSDGTYLRQYELEKNGKSHCLTSVLARAMVAEPIAAAYRTYPRTPNGEPREKRLELRKDEKSNCLTSVLSDSMVCEPITEGSIKRIIKNIRTENEKAQYLTATCYKGTASNGMTNIAEPIRIGNIDTTAKDKNSQQYRVYSVQSKSICLSANGGGGDAKTGLYKIDLPDGDYIVRKLTPIECERLQTLPDGFTEWGAIDYVKSNIEKYKKGIEKGMMRYGMNEEQILERIANTNRYKAIGNGWTCDVIAHIFSYLPEEYRL